MTISALLALGLLVYLATKVSRTSRRWKELPPGPPTVPVLGNLHQLSPIHTHKLYAPSHSLALRAHPARKVH
jgi:hypothetical protein